MWPFVRALDFVVDLQLENGAISWGRSPEGDTHNDSLLTGSASTYQALRCGLALAELFGESQPEWEIAAGRLQHAVAAHPRRSWTRATSQWTGTTQCSVGLFMAGGSIRHVGSRLGQVHHRRVWRSLCGGPAVDDGCRNRRTCDPLIINGQEAPARQLLSDIQCLRREDGSYWTGIVVDEGKFWPPEASTWTAAAIVLACDALAEGPTLDLFVGKGLPLVCPSTIKDAAARNAQSRSPSHTCGQRSFTAS